MRSLLELKKGEPYTPKGGVNMLAAICSALLVFVLFGFGSEAGIGFSMSKFRQN